MKIALSRVAVLARAWLYLALLGLSLAAPAHAATQTLTILGANGTPGSVEANTDYSKDGGLTWHPAYLFTGHPWGYISGTNAWLNQDPSPFVGLNDRVDFRIRFYAPSTWTNAQMTYEVNADNEADILINGVQAVHTVGGPISSGTLPTQYLLPGLNVIYVRLIDYGGWVGLNYRIDLSMEADQPLQLLTPPPSITSSLSATGTVNVPFGYTVTATNSPTSFAASNLPPGLSINPATGLISGTPTTAGSFNVLLTASSNFGSGSNTLALTIGKGAGAVVLGNLNQTYDGTVKSASATTTPAGMAVAFTYTGAGLPPKNAGSYGVFAVINNANYAGSTNGTLLINKASASVSLSNLTQSYDGSPKTVGVATNPAGLPTNVTYNGSSVPPAQVGSYTVAANISHQNYSGSTSGTLKIVDTTKPVITVPASPIVVDATSPSGTAVTFSATATDDVNGSVPVTFSPASGSTFLPGLTTVTATATDAAGNVATATFTVRVRYVTLTVDKATVTVNEGATATNSGLFGEAGGEAVALSVSKGALTQTSTGVWTYQQTLDGGTHPIELSLDRQENLYVINEGFGVLKYDPAGNLLKSWAVSGSRGIAVDNTNNVLYVVANGWLVQKFDLDGNLLSSFGSAGSGVGQFNNAHCVAVDAAGNIYVSDSFNSRIQVFSADGTFLRQWGSYGSGDGQFDFNQGIRIAANGNVYVADRNNNRIQYFSPDGTFLGKWGTAGSGDGQFLSPAGVGIDPSGNVYVGDLFNYRVQKFTSTGVFVDKFGPGTGAGTLDQPHGTVFPTAGRSIYIASWANGKVIKYLTPGAWSWSYTAPLGSVGTSTVNVTATLSGGATTTRSFTLTVLDATKPELTVPADLTLEATSAAGAVATFSATATDNVTASPTIAYSKAPGSTFPLGTTTVTVTATDAANNVATKTFAVTVRDTTRPVISVPANIVAEATSAAGAAVSYNATATDLVSGNVAVTGTPAAGAIFPLGPTPVNLTATDAAGNLQTASFTVTVKDTTKPVLTLPTSPIVVEATGATGAAVSFATSATDLVSGNVSVTTSAASGSQFALGDTVVTASAQDAAGNVASGSFTVTVRDTTAPVILMSAATPEPIALVNAGFESPATTSFDTNLQGWTKTGDAGVTSMNGLVVQFGGKPAPGGTQIAFLNNGAIAQSVGTVIEAGKTYTLSGYVGRRSDDPQATGRLSLTTAGGVVLANVDSAANQALGSFVRYQVSYTAMANDANLGAALRIVLTNTSSPQQVNFDAITLTSVPTPTAAPTDLAIEATSSSGAVVDYVALAQDAVSGVLSVNGSPASGTTFPIGATPVTLSAVDAAGNPATANFTVTVRDTTKPVLQLPADQTIEATSAAGAVATFNVTATDNVGASVTTSPASGSTFPVGTTAVNVTAKDDAGNETAGSFNITVVDRTKPVIAAPADIVTEATSAAGAVVTFSASANDIVDGSVPVNASPASGSVFPVGTTPVTLTATDANGNTATAVFSVTVTDTTAPVIAPQENLVVEATSAAGAVVTFTPTSLDLVSGAVNVVAAPDSGSTFALGVTTVTLTATDAAGNSATSSFTVTVVDTTAPTLATPANITVEATSAAGAVVSFNPTADDLVDGAVTVTASPASGSTFALGTTTVSLTAKDAAGNTATSSFTVSVVDTTAPVLTTPANQIIEATGPSGASTTFAASATDAVGATIAYSPAPGGTFPLGSTTVTVTASDAANNVSTGTFTILVRDTIAPVLTLPAGQTLEATSASGASATFSATASDIVSENLPVAFTPASGSTFALGSTTVTAVSSDAAGNTSSGTFAIVVRDTTAPVITAPADIVLEATGASGAVATFAASAADIVDGNVSVTASPASGSTFALGTTAVTLTANDAAANTSTATFNVTVQDTTAPAISVPADITIESTTVLGAAVSFTVTATDIVNGARPVTLSKASGSTFPIGTTTVIATAVDVAGNTATASFNVTVHAPAAAVVNTISGMNGRIDGSIQQLDSENVALNGGAAITGELLVPGTPKVRLNGKPTTGGTVDATGAANPSNYTVTLNGNVTLGKLVRRFDPIALPTVAAPSNPTGTRSVNMNKSTDPIGSWSTIKDLTLNGNVGSVAVPAGVYGNFTANGGSGFTLGVAGATTPSVYHFQRLTLNGNSTFRIVGPVVIVLKNDLNANGAMGNAGHPEWLDLQISNGSLTLNGNVAVYAYVVAPKGTVTINGNSELRGGLAADKLVLNGNSKLTLLRR